MAHIEACRKARQRDLLIIDDWLRDPVSADQARQIIDILDDRFRNKSTLLTSRRRYRPGMNGSGPTLADAILDRLVHDAHRLELKGDSMRKNTLPLDGKRPLKTQEEIQRRFAPRGGRFQYYQPFSVKSRK